MERVDEPVVLGAILVVSTGEVIERSGRHAGAQFVVDEIVQFDCLGCVMEANVTHISEHVENPNRSSIKVNRNEGEN